MFYQKKKALSGHVGFVTALAVLRDGRLASGSRDKTMALNEEPQRRACPQSVQRRK